MHAHFFYFYACILYRTNKLIKYYVGNNNKASRMDIITWTDIPDIIKNITIRGKARSELSSPANYVRFYLSKIFLKKIKKIIYIDNDIIAIHAIDEIWNIDLNNNIIGMVNQCQNNFFYKHVIEEKHYNYHHKYVLQVFQHFNHSCFPNTGAFILMIIIMIIISNLS